MEVQRLVEYQEEAWGRGGSNNFFPTPSPAASLTLPRRSTSSTEQMLCFKKVIKILDGQGGQCREQQPKEDAGMRGAASSLMYIL